jgi:hypothetical protein
LASGEEETGAGGDDETDKRRLGYSVGVSEENNEDNKAEVLQALATSMLGLLVVPCVCVVVLVFYWGRKLHKSWEKAFNKMWRVFFWNGPIRYWIESYIGLALSACSWFILPHVWSNSMDVMINVFCLLHFFVYVLSPWLVGKFLRKNFDKFRDPEFRAKFHELTSKLNRHDQNSSYYYVIFCYRRFLLCAYIVFLARHSSLQIQLQTYTI